MARILLVEPDRILAETYFKALRAAGHQVTACAGAQSAIMAADQIKPELIVLELQLVEHSGIEFLYEFRSYIDWQVVPVVVHTMVPPAEFTTSQQLLKDQLGVTAYLYKPQTSLQALTAAVDAQLSVTV